MDTGFPRELSGKESACQARDSDSIPGLWSPLEEEMATLSSIFDWKIPQTEEPVGYIKVHEVTKELDMT